MTLRSDDRVLLLAIPPHREVARMASALHGGLLVALGTTEEVDAARAELSRFDNVMFVNAVPNSIPWQESFFTRIVVPPHLEPLMRSAAPELHRVLAPGGEIVLDRHDA